MKLQKLPAPEPELVNWVKEALEEVPSHPRRQFEEAVASLIQLERERFVNLLVRPRKGGERNCTCGLAALREKGQ